MKKKVAIAAIVFVAVILLTGPTLIPVMLAVGGVLGILALGTYVVKNVWNGKPEREKEE